MAMTIAEANDTNALLRHIQRLQRGEPIGPQDNARALEAAEHLALKVNRALLCGVTPEQIREGWPT